MNLLVGNYVDSGTENLTEDVMVYAYGLFTVYSVLGSLGMCRRTAEENISPATPVVPYCLLDFYTTHL